MPSDATGLEVSDTSEIVGVTVHTCSIEIVKDCTNAQGESGDYGVDITVTNTGSVDVTNVTVNDDQVGSDVILDVTLAPGASENFMGTYPANGISPSTNTATVTSAIALGVDLSGISDFAGVCY